MKEKGFTLIELLVVIAIIGLLSTLAVVSLNNTYSKARDSKRQSDVKILYTAIELYATENTRKPDVPADWEALVTDLSTQLHGGEPQDPGTNRWCYCSDNAAGSIKYLVAVVLEESKEVSGDLDNNDITGTYELDTECMCNNNTVPATFDCGDSATGDLDDQTNVTVMCLGSV